MHVVWDWNGTLFDDFHIVVDAVNASLAAVGGAPIDADGYRTHYGRPVRSFYERLLGRPLTEPEWATMEETFHATYRNALDRARLAADAGDAVAEVAAGGGSQSILSMWWHDELVPFVAHFGLDASMLRVEGTRHDASATKAEHLGAHLAALGMGGNGVLMIGDALDDARAAEAAGVRCVLYDGGSHHRHELEAAGVPVAESLLDAVRLGGRGAVRP